MKRVSIVGNDEVIRPAVRDAVRRIVPATRRLSWTSRYSTATTLVNDLVANHGLDPSRVWVAT
ncbi:MAG: hypothetical protein ACRDUY_04245, partial [Nitriliruptorales bacterium]